MKIFTSTQGTIFLATFLFFLPLSFNAQTLIDFDDDDKWIRGSSTIVGYAMDHSYRDGLFSATGGEACRITSTDKDGVPGAKGTYAWKLKDVTAVDWRMTIASGGVGTFSIDIRRWDNDPGPNYLLDYSTDGGTQWEEVAQINNATLDDLSAWKTFSGTINSSNDDILIRLTPTQGTERIMVDNFEWTSFVPNGMTSPFEEEIEIWPNPAAQIINGKAESSLSLVELINMTGRMVKGKKLSGEKEFSIPVNDVKNGVYFVRMIDVSGKETCTRIVVLH